MPTKRKTGHLNRDSKRGRSTLSEPSSPRNQAREDHPPTGSQQHDMQASVPPLPIEWRILQLIAQSLAPGGMDESNLDSIRRNVEPLCQESKLDNVTFASKEQFKMNVEQQQSQFIEVFHKAVDENANDGDRMALLNHSAFWVASESYPQPVELLEQIAREEAEAKAIEDSWKAEFVGGPTVRALQEHVGRVLSMGNLYARYCSIVQSSGMGKSRLLDEFSKHHFLIPVNLRPKYRKNQDGNYEFPVSGFPPPDNAVRDFLVSPDDGSGRDTAKDKGKGKGKDNESHDEEQCDRSLSRICHFLVALFIVTTTTIQMFDAVDEAAYIEKFRAFMSEGQSMNASGPKRAEFYQAVVSMAKANMARGNFDKDEATRQITAAFKKLQAQLDDGLECGSESARAAAGAKSMRVYIAFDEAHPLTRPFTHRSAESDFSQLRRALNQVQRLPFFTFFLSTIGKISQFTPPRSRDASERMVEGELDTPLPFIHLGFDQLMGSRKVFHKFKTLDDVISLDCIAHMGRPLWGTQYDCGSIGVRDGLLRFALQKLLCATLGSANDSNEPLKSRQIYAILSQRLPLDVNSTVYTPLPLNQVDKEQEQISNHLRVVVSIGVGIESIRGIAASEPILSEAACLIMHNPNRFCLEDALSDVLERYATNTGDRAELLVAALFTWARDNATVGKVVDGKISSYFSVNELLSNLFSEATFGEMSGAMPSLRSPNAQPEKLGEAFRSAWMHFNHFIKPQKQNLLRRYYLLRFMARGAAAFGANCQAGVDAVYPFLYDNKELDVSKLGFIMVQVKTNDVSGKAREQIFKKMDPYDTNLLLPGDEGEDGFPIPIIRIVFALTSKEQGVTQQIYELPEDRFTSYDFWCSGFSPAILRPVQRAPEKWESMIGKADRWETYYNAAPEPEVLRSQFPACSDHTAHFDAWCIP